MPIIIRNYERSFINAIFYQIFGILHIYQLSKHGISWLTSRKASLLNLRIRIFKRKYAKPASHVIFAFVSHHSVCFQQKLSAVVNFKKLTAKKGSKINWSLQLRLASFLI